MLWLRRVTSSQLPSGSTMRHHTRLSTAVPHNTAFLPPAFMAILPPTQDASADVGSTANTKPAPSAASVIRRVTTPAAENIVAARGAGSRASGPTGRARISTAPRSPSFSVLITADHGVRGTAPPV